jgi:NH3-dependent NAD+ synthetase
MALDIPRTIDPAQVFDALVQWFYDEMIVKRKAPGFLVGLSGTDSLVAFLAAAKAFEKAGKPNRVMGIHFAPSEDFVYDHPEAEVHLWFRDEVIPWLRQQAPGAQVGVDATIDWRYDGLRWGSLMDMSVVVSGWSAATPFERYATRRMLSPEEQYWVVGTRNLTEDTLLNYSNASTAASLQPLIHLWKSEILQLSEYLGAPKVAIDKSCETDCICGRMRLPAQHIPEVDMILMARRKELSWEYVEQKIPLELQKQLTGYIRAQLLDNAFKKSIPYTPNPHVFAFESGTIDVKKFNHFGHMYIAFCYLKSYPLDQAVERYAKYLKPILEKAGQMHRFNLELTKAYFVKLDKIMKEFPAYDDFGELAEAIPSVLDKIKA